VKRPQGEVTHFALHAAGITPAEAFHDALL